MNKFIIALGLAATMSSAAFAQETQVAEATVFEPDETALQEEVMLRLEEICAVPNIVLSEKATRACTGEVDALPRILKDGTRFSSRGVGAEFNALINNISNFK